MTVTEKIYHIYAKDQCLFHSLKEEEFKETWKSLHKMVGIMKTEYTEKDLSFVEIPLQETGGGGGNNSYEPPGSPSY